MVDKRITPNAPAPPAALAPAGPPVAPTPTPGGAAPRPGADRSEVVRPRPRAGATPDLDRIEVPALEPAPLPPPPDKPAVVPLAERTWPGGASAKAQADGIATGDPVALAKARVMLANGDARTRRLVLAALEQGADKLDVATVAALATVVATSFPGSEDREASRRLVLGRLEKGPGPVRVAAAQGIGGWVPLDHSANHQVPKALGPEPDPAVLAPLAHHFVGHAELGPRALALLADRLVPGDDQALGAMVAGLRAHPADARKAIAAAAERGSPVAIDLLLREAMRDTGHYRQPSPEAIAALLPLAGKLTPAQVAAMARVGALDLVAAALAARKAPGSPLAGEAAAPVESALEAFHREGNGLLQEAASDLLRVMKWGGPMPSPALAGKSWEALEKALASPEAEVRENAAHRLIDKGLSPDRPGWAMVREVARHADDPQLKERVLRAELAAPRGPSGPRLDWQVLVAHLADAGGKTRYPDYPLLDTDAKRAMQKRLARVANDHFGRAGQRGAAKPSPGQPPAPAPAREKLAAWPSPDAAFKAALAKGDAAALVVLRDMLIRGDASVVEQALEAMRAMPPRHLTAEDVRLVVAVARRVPLPYAPYETLAHLAKAGSPDLAKAAAQGITAHLAFDASSEYAVPELAKAIKEPDVVAALAGREAASYQKLTPALLAALRPRVLAGDEAALRVLMAHLPAYEDKPSPELELLVQAAKAGQPRALDALMSRVRADAFGLPKTLVAALEDIGPRLRPADLEALLGTAGGPAIVAKALAAGGIDAAGMERLRAAVRHAQLGLDDHPDVRPLLRELAATATAADLDKLKELHDAPGLRLAFAKSPDPAIRHEAALALLDEGARPGTPGWDALRDYCFDHPDRSLQERAVRLEYDLGAGGALTFKRHVDPTSKAVAMSVSHETALDRERRLVAIDDARLPSGARQLGKLTVTEVGGKQTERQSMETTAVQLDKGVPKLVSRYQWMEHTRELKPPSVHETFTRGGPGGTSRIEQKTRAVAKADTDLAGRSWYGKFNPQQLLKMLGPSDLIREQEIETRVIDASGQVSHHTARRLIGQGGSEVLLHAREGKGQMLEYKTPSGIPGLDNHQTFFQGQQDTIVTQYGYQGDWLVKTTKERYTTLKDPDDPNPDQNARRVRPNADTAIRSKDRATAAEARALLADAGLTAFAETEPVKSYLAANVKFALQDAHASRETHPRQVRREVAIVREDGTRLVLIPPAPGEAGGYRGIFTPPPGPTSEPTILAADAEGKVHAAPLGDLDHVDAAEPDPGDLSVRKEAKKAKLEAKILHGLVNKSPALQRAVNFDRLIVSVAWAKLEADAAAQGARAVSGMANFKGLSGLGKGLAVVAVPLDVWSISHGVSRIQKGETLSGSMGILSGSAGLVAVAAPFLASNPVGWTVAGVAAAVAVIAAGVEFVWDYSSDRRIAELEI